MLNIGWNLSFNGQCEEAFRFYEKCLGGKIDIMMTWGESPLAKEVPADFAGKITHATLHFGDQELTGGDLPPGQYEKPQGFSVLLNLQQPAEAERIYKALCENGRIRVPLAETFWSARFGMVTDRFGTPWMINCAKAAS